MATQMAFYPNAPGSMNSPFQSRHAAGQSAGNAAGGNNSFLSSPGASRLGPGAEPPRAPIPPGRHMFHPFNRPYPKPGQDRSDYDSKQLRKSSMRKTVDYYSSVIRMLEVNYLVCKEILIYTKSESNYLIQYFYLYYKLWDQHQENKTLNFSSVYSIYL